MRERESCLHLVASAGRSLTDTHPAWEGLDGAFRRFPIGVRKVGQIAKTGKSLEVADVAHDQAWAADSNWIRDERIAAFAGHPLLHRGEVLGVLGLFARERPGQACFEWLRMIADHLAAALANARALDEIDSLKRRLEQENEYLREEVQQVTSFGDLIAKVPPCKRRLGRSSSWPRRFRRADPREKAGRAKRSSRGKFIATAARGSSAHQGELRCCNSSRTI